MRKLMLFALAGIALVLSGCTWTGLNGGETSSAYSNSSSAVSYTVKENAPASTTESSGGCPRLAPGNRNVAALEAAGYRPTPPQRDAQGRTFTRWVCGRTATPTVVERKETSAPTPPPPPVSSPPAPSSNKNKRVKLVPKWHAFVLKGRDSVSREGLALAIEQNDKDVLRVDAEELARVLGNLGVPSTNDSGTLAGFIRDEKKVKVLLCADVYKEGKVETYRVSSDGKKFSTWRRSCYKGEKLLAHETAGGKFVPFLSLSCGNPIVPRKP